MTKEKIMTLLGKLMVALNGTELLTEVTDALNELLKYKQIDNANPSEALRYLEDLKMTCGTKIKLDKAIGISRRYEYIKQTLLKAQEQDRVLDIIKEKKVDVSYLEKCDSVDEYNLYISNYDNNYWKRHSLTQDEFDLLKEMLA